MIKRKKILELGEVITGKTPSKSFNEPFGEQLPFFTPTDIQDQRYLDKTNRNLSFESEKKLKKYILPKNSILVTCIGSDMGKICISKSEGVSNQQINAIIPNKENDYLFLYYLLRTKRKFLKNFAASGSTMPIINKTDFSNLEFLMPDLPYQINISSFLSKFDDKIELNQKMNETLEEIAKTLFKSWFIDFDPVRAKAEGRPTGLSKVISDLFPDSFEDSELGEIPKGWKCSSISSKYDFLPGFAFKSKDWIEEGVPVVKIKSIDSGIVDLDTDTFVSDEFLGTKSNYILNEGDILIAMTGATIGKVGTVPTSTKKTLLNQRVGKFIHRDNTKNFFLNCFVSSRLFSKNIENLATGSARDNIGKDQILSIKTVIPNDDVYNKFGELTEDIRKKVLIANKENKILEKLRDTLLPKLISGELQIPDAENLVEEAGI
jgi:type I restriction enzyme, S subunit